MMCCGVRLVLQFRQLSGIAQHSVKYSILHEITEIHLAWSSNLNILFVLHTSLDSSAAMMGLRRALNPLQTSVPSKEEKRMS